MAYDVNQNIDLPAEVETEDRSSVQVCLPNTDREIQTEFLLEIPEPNKPDYLELVRLLHEANIPSAQIETYKLAYLRALQFKNASEQVRQELLAIWFNNIEINDIGNLEDLRVNGSGTVSSRFGFGTELTADELSLYTAAITLEAIVFGPLRETSFPYGGLGEKLDEHNTNGHDVLFRVNETGTIDFWGSIKVSEYQHGVEQYSRVCAKPDEVGRGIGSDLLKSAMDESLQRGKVVFLNSRTTMLGHKRVTNMGDIPSVAMKPVSGNRAVWYFKVCGDPLWETAVTEYSSGGDINWESVVEHAVPNGGVVFNEVFDNNGQPNLMIGFGQNAIKRIPLVVKNARPNLHASVMYQLYASVDHHLRKFAQYQSANENTNPLTEDELKNLAEKRTEKNSCGINTARQIMKIQYELQRLKSGLNRRRQWYLEALASLQ